MDLRPGRADMAPVERERAALTSLGPERVSANPHCWNAVRPTAWHPVPTMRLSGKALAILLAGIRKTANPEHHEPN